MLQEQTDRSCLTRRYVVKPQNFLYFLGLFNDLKLHLNSLTMARAQSCRVLENGPILPLSLARAHAVGINTSFTEVKIKRSSTSSKVPACLKDTRTQKK